MNPQIQIEIQELAVASPRQKAALKDWLKEFGVDDIYRITAGGERTIKGYPCNAFAYAHNAYRIASMIETFVGIEKMEFHVRNAVGLVLSQFVTNYASTGNDEKDTQRMRHLANLVITQYGSKVSLFGLTHALGLLGSFQEPCAVVLEYYNPQLVLRALNQYVSHCRTEYDSFSKKVKQRIEYEHNERIGKDPEICDAVRGTMKGFNAMMETKQATAAEVMGDPNIKKRFDGHPQYEFSKQVNPAIVEATIQAQMEFARQAQAAVLGEDAEIDFD